MLRRDVRQRLVALFVRGETTAGSIGARSNAARHAALFDEGIEPRATHFVVYDEVVDRITAIVICHDPCSQVKRIGGGHKCPP